MTPILEDYLEKIYFLSSSQKIVRVKDLANYFKVKAPTVLEKLRYLEDLKLLKHKKYSFIELTSKGKKLAQSIAKKHSSIKVFFEKVLGMDPGKAEKNSCIIEHHLCNDTTKRIEEFLKFIKNSPGANYTDFPKYYKNLKNKNKTKK